MAKIALLSQSSRLAHAGRVVAIARVLREQGHEVTLVGQPYYLESSLLVDRAEFRFEPLFEPDFEAMLRPARGHKAQLEQAFAFAGAVHDELRLMSSLRPELVLVDGRPTATVSAASLRIPAVTLVDASGLGPLCALDPTVSELAELRTRDELLASPEHAEPTPDGLVPLSPIALPTEIANFCTQQGLLPPAHLHGLNLGDRTLILDPAELYPVRDLPPSVLVTGPVLFDVAVQPPRWLARLTGERPLVYVTFEGSDPRFEYAVEQLAALDAQVVVASPELLPLVPDGVLGARYLPASEMARRAALVVCDGGSHTMYHALAQGTPVLAIPATTKHAIQTLPLVRAGAARVVPKTAVVPGATTLANTVTDMLASASYRDSASRLRQHIDSAAAMAALCDALPT